ncbi:ferredoxin [Rhodococcus sp. 27YEA15]|uniref:ferredoxin n=1 Tax=Rhodococcus sp. 27YEA15 TaxID=3156259 RepID=UPI003C7BEA52
MKVTINGNLCVGSGQCVDFAPDVFEQRGDGVAQALSGDVPEELESEVREAWESCPVMAIKFDGE